MSSVGVLLDELMPSLAVTPSPNLLFLTVLLSLCLLFLMSLFAGLTAGEVIDPGVSDIVVNSLVAMLSSSLACFTASNSIYKEYKHSKKELANSYK